MLFDVSGGTRCTAESYSTAKAKRNAQPGQNPARSGATTHIQRTLAFPSFPIVVVLASRFPVFPYEVIRQTRAEVAFSL